MEMKEVFDKLKSLQDVLVKKYALEKEKENLPKQFEQQDELLARLRKEFIEKSKNYEDLKAVVDNLRTELAQAESSREAGEKNMDNITSHREYEALDKQITEATEKEAAVRKDLAHEEKILNDLSKELKNDEESINSVAEGLNARKDAQKVTMQEIDKELEDLAREEKDITEKLSEANQNQEIVYKFQRIIQRNSEGIVAVRNGVCTGCQMILPAQFANKVRDNEEILFCPYCSRVLFYQEVAENEVEDFSSLDETGSLADFDDEFADERDEDEEDENDYGDSDTDGSDEEKSMVFDV